jgi:hypothetical protein
MALAPGTRYKYPQGPRSTRSKSVCSEMRQSRSPTVAMLLTANLCVMDLSTPDTVTIAVFEKTMRPGVALSHVSNVS